MASESDMEVDLESSKRRFRRSTSPFSQHYYPDKNKSFSDKLDLYAITMDPEKRGRPPSVNRHSLPSKSMLTDITPKKRGRPPSVNRYSLPSKSLNTESENKSPKKRGRPSSINLFSLSAQSTPEKLNQENVSPNKRYRSRSVSSSSSRRSSIRRERLNELSDSDQQYISFDEEEEEEEEDLADLLGGLTIDRAKNVDVERFNKFTGWTGIETRSSYHAFMQAVDEKIFNMDHVEETLRRGLQKVLSGNEGVLFTLYGKAGSGRRTVINRVFGGEENFNFVELNGRFAKLTEVKNDLKVVEDRLKEEDKPLVFVLYDFDALRLSFANKVLYALTNLLRKKPFFLLLVTEKENAIESLEKRIVSRVGQSFIKCMDRRLKVEDCWKLVHKLVEAGVSACNDQSIKEAFKLSGSPPKHFDRLCNRLPCYSELKLFVKRLADKVFDGIESKSAFSSKKICNELLTLVDETVDRLKCLTDRMYGLLVAAAVKTMHITKRIPVKSIHQEYLRFLNTKTITNPFLQLSSEQELLDDVEYLVFQRFWVAKRQNQKIVGISWLEDPLKVLFDKYYVLFNTDLANWAKSAMKDDSKLR
ncbi:ORC4-C domain-containing protein [Aphelenchoides bicaudatus]|nr:ORC4-C domain-containing protein [Aphelenchoides bicaudatus]